MAAAAWITPHTRIEPIQIRCVSPTVPGGETARDATVARTVSV